MTLSLSHPFSDFFSGPPSKILFFMSQRPFFLEGDTDSRVLIALKIGATMRNLNCRSDEWANEINECFAPDLPLSLASVASQ